MGVYKRDEVRQLVARRYECDSDRIFDADGTRIIPPWSSTLPSESTNGASLPFPPAKARQLRLRISPLLIQVSGLKLEPGDVLLDLVKENARIHRLFGTDLMAAGDVSEVVSI